MKLMTLTLRAFGPYPGEHTIPFSDFDSAGVYLISGPTGAGKSSILDAVVFALYGSIPRFDLASGVRNSVRSDLADADTETSVTLEFEVGGTVYRVERSPAYERAKRRGSGTTTKSAKCTLLVHREGEWKSVATSVSEASTQIEHIVGLRRDQFQQIIVLAQGRFAEFLHSDSSKREVILRRLFDSGRFQRATEIVATEAEATKATLADIERQLEEARQRAAARAEQLGIEPDEDAEVGDLVDALEKLAADRASAHGAAEKSVEIVVSRLQAAESFVRDTATRDRSMRELADLDEQSEQTERMRERLERSDRVHEIWPSVVALDAAREQLGAAKEALADFDDAETGRDVTDLEDRSRRLRDDIAVLRAHVETERSIPALRAASKEAAAALEQASAAYRQTNEQLTAAPERRRDASATLDRLRKALEQLDEGRLEVSRLKALIEQTEQRAAAAAAHETAVSAEEQAALKHQHAAESTRAVLQRFYDSTSARLASTLQDGDQCPVCGSHEHPLLASSPDDQIVSTEEVESAQTAESQALAALHAAQTQTAAASNDLAGLSRLLEGVETETLPQRLKAAREQEAERKQSEARAEEAEQAVEDLDREHDRLRAAAESLSEDVAARRSEADVAAERLDAAVRAVQEHVTDADATVADRLSSMLEQSRHATAVLDAVNDFARREQEAAAAQAAFDSLIVEHPAGSEATVREWRMSRADASTTRQQVTQHDNERARITGLLSQPHILALEDRIAESEADIESLRAEVSTAKTALALAADQQAATRSALADAKREQALTDDLRNRIADLGERAVAVARLASTLKGDSPNSRRMRLETYVLAANLEAILEAANVRLAALTDGRFSLEHFDGLAARGASSGLGVLVNDAYTGLTRAVSTLSGGETFLASLALALGLADVVQQNAGGISLETLFIDEGFGSLDAQTLELAMQTLGELHAAGRTIGVISHVTSMQERLPQLIEVTPLPGGQGSSISVSEPN